MGRMFHLYRWWPVTHVFWGVQATTSRKYICNALKKTDNIKRYKTLVSNRELKG